MDVEEKGWGDSRLLACKSPADESRGIPRWIRGEDDEETRKDARVEGMRAEGEWVNCKTRSSVFLS